MSRKRCGDMAWVCENHDDRQKAPARLDSPRRQT
jgi:hypothetical protein